MATIIQKFGGTSVSTLETQKNCIRHIKKEKEKGNHVVVVVSAMGRKGQPYATDTLLSLLGDHPKVQKREKDLLLSTGELISATLFSNLLWEENIPNVALNGGQAGIETTNEFGQARIKSLKPSRIRQEFNVGNVVIVTGFQGMDVNGEVTTLGRGGSDTSAAALGAALNAERIDIFTDVDGIYTADPNVVEDATLLKYVSYNEICNLAHLGAKVIHPRAVEIAMQVNIPIHVRSTFKESGGTIVTNITELNDFHGFRDRLITGITYVNNVTQFKVFPENGQTALQKDVFEILSTNKISIDLINVTTLGALFTVNSDEANHAKDLLTKSGFLPHLTPECAKISIVGGGMTGIPGVMYTIMKTLYENDIPVLQSSDSHTTLWVLVEQKHLHNAVKLLHKAFNEKK